MLLVRATPIEPKPVVRLVVIARDWVVDGVRLCVVSLTLRPSICMGAADAVLVGRGGRDVTVDRGAVLEPLRRTGAANRDEVRGVVSIRPGEVLTDGRLTVKGFGGLTGVTDRRMGAFWTAGFGAGVYFGVVARG